MQAVYYIGLDVHKKKIAYCIQTSAGKIVDQGMVASTRPALSNWVAKLPTPWAAAMEATLFTGWIYDLGNVVAGLDATFRLRLLLCFPECTMILKPSRALLLSRCDLPPDSTFSLSSGHNVMPDDDPSSEIACVKSDRCLKLRRRTRKRHHVKT